MFVVAYRYITVGQKAAYLKRKIKIFLCLFEASTSNLLLWAVYVHSSTSKLFKFYCVIYTDGGCIRENKPVSALGLPLIPGTHPETSTCINCTPLSLQTCIIHDDNECFRFRVMSLAHNCLFRMQISREHIPADNCLRLWLIHLTNLTPHPPTPSPGDILAIVWVVGGRLGVLLLHVLGTIPKLSPPPHARM